MASARCVYCDATLQPNSMYCLECGQLIPQQPARPPVPSQFAAPAASGQPTEGAQRPRPTSSRIEAVPLPGTLPWQQRRAGIESSVESAAPTPQPVARTRVDRVELAFSTGQRVTVAGSAVIGRKPGDTALAMGVQGIEVADDTRSVSRVHLVLEVADGTITVGDVGSSNGSGIERNGVVTQLESAGPRVEAFPGDTVWVGDISFVVRAF
ncbi:FHA domain-containing protein [Agromyces sp. NPDC049794]|uniref:FHA domain-containing protein n=1 Tax=unclassified Agromyces TaxID=2639701 RepID=UPI0033F39D1A